MPLMVTGGFRSRAGMSAALGEPGRGDCDVIGLGRPLITDPAFPRRLLAGEVDGISSEDRRLRLRERGWLAPESPLLMARALNAFAAQAWYYCQIFRLAERGVPQADLGVAAAMREYVASELRAAYATRKAYPRRSGQELGVSG